ncbi:MAG: hypothetical protein H6R17_1469 [Proteobacteria bacterium]|nr:hypothetical protein [Pseudomonadota bacterium]
MSINFNSRGRQPQGLVAQVLTVIGGALVLGAAFMFSLVFFAVLAIAGLIFWLYFMWKTRALRRQMREQLDAGARGSASPPSAAGDIIEGEAVRVVDERHRLDE